MGMNHNAPAGSFNLVKRWYNMLIINHIFKGLDLQVMVCNLSLHCAACAARKSAACWKIISPKQDHTKVSLLAKFHASYSTHIVQPFLFLTQGAACDRVSEPVAMHHGSGDYVGGSDSVYHGACSTATLRTNATIKAAEQHTCHCWFDHRCVRAA